MFVLIMQNNSLTLIWTNMQSYISILGQIKVQLLGPRGPNQSFNFKANSVNRLVPPTDPFASAQITWWKSTWEAFLGRRWGRPFHVSKSEYFIRDLSSLPGFHYLVLTSTSASLCAKQITIVSTFASRGQSCTPRGNHIRSNYSAYQDLILIKICFARAMLSVSYRSSNLLREGNDSNYLPQQIIRASDTRCN